jgi:hypothetical protein
LEMQQVAAAESTTVFSCLHGTCRFLGCSWGKLFLASTRIAMRAHHVWWCNFALLGSSISSVIIDGWCSVIDTIFQGADIDFFFSGCGSASRWWHGAALIGKEEEGAC